MLHSSDPMQLPRRTRRTSSVAFTFVLQFVAQAPGSSGAYAIDISSAGSMTSASPNTPTPVRAMATTAPTPTPTTIPISDQQAFVNALALQTANVLQQDSLDLGYSVLGVTVTDSDMSQLIDNNNDTGGVTYLIPSNLAFNGSTPTIQIAVGTNLGNLKLVLFNAFGELVGLLASDWVVSASVLDATNQLALAPTSLLILQGQTTQTMSSDGSVVFDNLVVQRRPELIEGSSFKVIGSFSILFTTTPKGFSLQLPFTLIEEQSGLSVGAIVGIVVGTVVFIALIATAIILYCVVIKAISLAIATVAATPILGNGAIAGQLAAIDADPVVAGTSNAAAGADVVG